MGDFASKVLAEMGPDRPEEERPREKKGSVPDEVLKSLERAGDQDPSNQLSRAIAEGIQEPDEKPTKKAASTEPRTPRPVEEEGMARWKSVAEAIRARLSTISGLEVGEIGAGDPRRGAYYSMKVHDRETEESVLVGIEVWQD